jgi:hypothetical protein
MWRALLILGKEWRLMAEAQQETEPDPYLLPLWGMRFITT